MLGNSSVFLVYFYVAVFFSLGYKWHNHFEL